MSAWYEGYVNVFSASQIHMVLVLSAHNPTLLMILLFPNSCHITVILQYVNYYYIFLPLTCMLGSAEDASL